VSLESLTPSTVQTKSLPFAEAPRYSCSLAGALTSTLGIFGGVPILHSGAGCGLGQQFGVTYAGGSNAAGGQGTTNTPCSCLVEEHVIFGGEDKLRKLIRSSTEVMVGDFFAVISGCIPSLIGDDVDAVVDEFREKVPLVHVKAPGFGGTSYDGYELLFEAIADQLLEARPVQKRLVNVFGVVPFQHLFWKGDLATIKRTLARIGVEANVVFTEFGGLENLKKIPAAELNLILSPWNGQRVAAKLEEKFGTPSTTFPGVPIGPKETARLLRQVAQALQLDAAQVEAAIQEEERHAYRFAEYFGDVIMMGAPHAYFAVAADSGTAINVTKYLVNEVAYLAEVVIVTDDPPEASRARIVEELTAGLETPVKPEVIFEADAYQIRQKLKGRSFLHLFSSSLEKHIAADEFNGALQHTVSFPSYDRLILDRSFAGFRGGLVLMEELISTVAGPL
jgi:nitrogenase molybdenum-iron protein beta chain